jgi:hypothetical protein
LGEEDELVGVALHLVRMDGQPEVVEEEELELELVEFGKGEAANLYFFVEKIAVSTEISQSSIMGDGG